MEQTEFSLLPQCSIAGCGACQCRTCLFWWSERCPYGECFDDWRAGSDPYDKAHPGQPARKQWSDWKTQQAWWCRGGVFYPTASCRHYSEYRGQTVQPCLRSNVSVFQDGYISCPIVDSVGCQACWEQAMQTYKNRR